MIQSIHTSRMKLLLGIILILTELICNAQIDRLPPNRDNCVSLNEMTPVVSGRITTILSGDSTPNYFYNFCQIDSIRVVFNDSCPIAPLIISGIINGQVLKDAWFHLTYSDDIPFESDYNVLIGDEKGNIDKWEGYYIFFGIKALTSFFTENTRVFSLESYSGRGDESTIFYLELKNPNTSSEMSLEEFMKYATVSCLKRWYCRI